MFKRIVTLLTVTALFCSLLSIGFSGSAVYEDDTVYGDIDGNGKVDTEDARLALKLASGVVLLEDEAQLKRADVNFDGVVTVFDARQILRGVAGLATLQPSGAFSGFDDSGLFSGSEEVFVAYFNFYLNKIKVVKSEDERYIAATITKTESDNLTGFNIKEAEIPAFGFGTSAEGIAAMVKNELTADDKENVVTVIPYGSNDFSLVSVEGEDYVSNLAVSDIFGAKAVYDSETGLVTMEVALPDTEMETAAQSAYAKVFNVTDILNEQNTTLMKLMKNSSGESAMRREFKNCVLKIVVDAATANVQSYTVSYESDVYVAQTNFGTNSLNLAKLKGITIQKLHSIKYEDFQWPEK
ncbi:MAG: dockerin type I repeat-containing protein [Acutalibacteraceae bacterium]